MKKTANILTAILAAVMLLCSCGDVNDTQGGAAGGSETSANTSPEVSGAVSTAETTAGTTVSAESTESSPGILDRIFGKKTGTNGKEYKNYNDYDKYGVIDGFCYNTEEDVTKTFVCFMRGDKPWLFDPSDTYFSDCDPAGLCDVEPGKIYTINYDVQHTTGGEAGVSESEFLKVMSCEETDQSALFSGSICYSKIMSARKTPYGRYFQSLPCFASGQRGSRFVGVGLGEGKGYKVFIEDGSELHFDEIRDVLIPFKTAEMPEGCDPIGFMVLCKKQVTDEQIVSGIKSGSLADNKDVLLIGSFSDRETAEYACKCAGVNDNTVPFYESEFAPDEGFRRVITMQQFESGVTPEELGIPEDVFYVAETLWRSDRDYFTRFKDGEERYPYSRGILILGGDFLDSDILFMDNNARFCIANRTADSGSHAGEHPMNYAILSVRQEYLDLIPQE